MPLQEASFNSTLRTIALLLIAWWLLRLFLRSRRHSAPQQRTVDQRPPGDVRIEKVPPKDARNTNNGIIDAEFEEIT